MDKLENNISNITKGRLIASLGGQSIKAGEITSDIDPWVTDINNSYNSATNTFFTGYSTLGSELGWLGFKVNGYCTLIAVRHNGHIFEGFRDTQGNWTFYKFPFGY